MAEISTCQIIQMFFCKQWDRWNMRRPPRIEWEKTFISEIHFGFKFSLFNILNQDGLFIVENENIVDKRGPVSKNWVSWYKKKNHGNVSFLMVKKFAYLVGLKSFCFFLNSKKTLKFHFTGISNNTLHLVIWMKWCRLKFENKQNKMFFFWYRMKNTDWQSVTDC